MSEVTACAPGNDGLDTPFVKPVAQPIIAFVQVNPRQDREFARAIGVLARTDRVDARVLAEMGRRLRFHAPIPPDPTWLRLAGFLRRRKQLVEARRAEKMRRHSAGQPEILCEIDTMIALLSRKIEKLDRLIAELIAQNPELTERARLLAPVSGIGSTVMATLLDECPNSARCADAASPPLLILLPMPGKAEMREARRIQGGRRKVREALYFAALTASRRIQSLEAMREPR